MPVGIVADLEIVQIHQGDARRADGFAGDFLIEAAVVSPGQGVVVKFLFECLLPCGALLVSFVQLRFLIFDQLPQLFIRCGKGGLLLAELFHQLPLPLFVIVLEFGKCRGVIVHVLAFFHMILGYIGHRQKRALPLFIGGGGG